MLKTKFISLYSPMLICCFLITASCKTTYSTSEVTYLANPEAGIISLSAIGYGLTQREAEQETYVTAFNTIFFKGVPGFDALRLPMIEDESKARRERASFFDKFYGEKGYLQFVTEQDNASKTGKADRGKIRVQRTIAINYEALRRHLEREGVIRKFGF